jgi:kinesin family member 22
VTQTVTIFAYGVTSSGKTHTMQGTREQPGVIPRYVKGLFEKRDGLPSEHAESISFQVSYIEIYKDEVFDLLVNRADVREFVSYSTVYE